jgi:hypothetical protein
MPDSKVLGAERERRPVGMDGHKYAADERFAAACKEDAQKEKGKRLPASPRELPNPVARDRISLRT